MKYSHTAFDVLSFEQHLGVLREFGLNLPSAKHARVLFRDVHRQYFMTVLVRAIADFGMHIILQVHVGSKCLYQVFTSHTVSYGAVLATVNLSFEGSLTER